MHSLIVFTVSLLSFFELGPKSYNSELAQIVSLANKGDLNSQLELASRYRDGNGVKQDNKKMFKYYKLAALQGHNDSEYFTGNMFYWGTGTRVNKVEAVKWFTIAANKGHAKAQHDLAYCYANGMGIKKDPKEATKWYKKAANEDYKPSQFNLANAYYKGLGVEKDLNQANLWAEMSGNQDVLTLLKKELTESDILLAKNKAFQTIRNIRLKKIKNLNQEQNQGEGQTGSIYIKRRTIPE
jgi:hypothetical protein